MKYPKTEYKESHFVLYDPIEDNYFINTNSELGTLKKGEIYFRPIFGPLFQYAERFDNQYKATARKNILFRKEVIPEMREKLHRLIIRVVDVTYSTREDV